MNEQSTVQIDRQELLASAHNVAALPASVARLAVLVADADSSMKEIVEVISYDQSLTMTLLRRANSAALGGREAIRTVQQAAVRLGPSSLLAMALSSSISNRMNRAIPAYGLREGELWRSSVAASLAAEVIRAKSGVDVPAEAATAALLHDVGKLVLANHFGVQVLDMLQNAAETEDVTLIDAEQAVFGATHADVGGIVAQNWKLPPTIVDAIVHHHGTRTGMPSACAAVSLAHVMSAEIVHDLDESAAAAQRTQVAAHREVMEELHIDPDHYPELVETSRQRYVDLSARYGVVA